METEELPHCARGAAKRGGKPDKRPRSRAGAGEVVSHAVVPLLIQLLPAAATNRS